MMTLARVEAARVVSALTVTFGFLTAACLSLTGGFEAVLGVACGVAVAVLYWELTSRVMRVVVTPYASSFVVGGALLTKTLFLFVISWALLRVGGVDSLGFGLGFFSLVVGLVVATLMAGDLPAEEEKGLAHG